MPDRSIAVLAMPSPRSVQAAAVWITARSWLLAAAERFGEAQLITPEGSIAVEDLDALIDSMLGSPSSPARKRSRLSIEGRTFVKDLRLAARHTRQSRLRPSTASVPGQVTPFVWQHHDPFFALGSQVARSVGAPLVQFVDAPHVWEARRWGVRRPGWGSVLERLGERPQLASADLVVCVSDEVAEAVERLTDAGARIVVAPCTADARFFARPAQRESVRTELGFEEGDVVVGWAGSFRRFHAVEDLVTAFQRAAPSHSGLRLMLVGDGPDRDRIQDMAGTLGISDRVVFTGSVPYSSMPSYVSAIDIAVVTARDAVSFHYSPLKLKEYRASGRSVIAPDAGQVRLTVKDGHNGSLYAPGDVRGLAQAISILAGDGELRTRFGLTARTDELASGGALAHVDIVTRELDQGS